MDGFPSAPALIVRATVFASHALVFGLVPVFLLVLRPSLGDARVGDEARARVARRAEAILLAALIAALAGSAGALLIQARDAADLLGVPLGARAFGLVARTQFGLWHLARLPLCLALVALLAGRVRTWSLRRDAAPARWWALWALLGAALLLSISMSGHAAASDLAALAVPNDVIHLAAGATWLGGVVALTCLLPAAWTGAGRASELAILAPASDRFARVAFRSMVVVAATGVGNTLLHVGSVADIVLTGYGRALGVKLLAFAAILGLGAVNHFVLRARLTAGLRAGEPVPEQALLRRSVAIELGLAAFVLGATAVLVNLPPPR